jgi:hypothetical protein
VSNSRGIYKIYPESFRANEYGTDPFRMIGLIDVGIMYNNTIERVTLGFYRSSGTNSGKIEGFWYPILGLKLRSGAFVEFTPFINFALERATKHGRAPRGWLAKSIFFMDHYNGNMIRGYSDSRHNKSLVWIGETLRELYENGQYINEVFLNPVQYNEILISNIIYDGNKYSQRDNFENLIEEIFFNK